MTFLGQDSHHPSIVPDHQAYAHRHLIKIVLYLQVVAWFIGIYIYHQYVIVSGLLALYTAYAFWAEMHYSAGVAYNVFNWISLGSVIGDYVNFTNSQYSSENPQYHVAFISLIVLYFAFIVIVGRAWRHFRHLFKQQRGEEGNRPLLSHDHESHGNQINTAPTFVETTPGYPVN
jgi:hypothetical protein